MRTFDAAVDRHQSGLGHLDQYRRHGTSADLDKAINDLSAAFNRAPGPVTSADLAEALIDAHDRYGARNQDWLDRAMAVLDRPAADTSQRARHLLAHALLARFERDGEHDDQRRAAALRRMATDDDTERLVHLDATAIYLGLDSSDEAVASKAVNILHAQVTATPADHTELGNRLTNLGSSLLRRAEWPERDDDLDEAIRYLTAAASIDQGFAVHGYSWLSNLGNALATRFERDGTTGDLDEAVDLYYRAVEACPPESPALPACLSNMGNALLDRFEIAGDPQDLTTGIDNLRAAVEHTPRRGVNHAVRLSNLGSGLLLSFEVTGDLDYLTEAIAVCREAVALAPPDSTDAPRWSNNLGNALMAAYETGDGAALIPAIEAHRRAVERTAPHDRERPSYLTGLGNALIARGDEGSVTAAIALYADALAGTPRPAPRHALALNNLANGYTELYALTGRRSQARRAIRLYRRALRATPRQAPEYAAWSYNLASTLASLLRQRWSLVATGRLRALYQRTCAIARQTSPDTYLATAHSWARWAAQRNAWRESAHAYRQATSAMRALVELQLLLSHKNRWLAGTRSLVAMSAYAHARAGQPRQAVLEIEQGRAITLTEMLEHMALERFAATTGSTLADKMNRLASEARLLRLARPGSTHVSTAADGYGSWLDDPATDIAARRRLRDELRATTAEIRALAGIRGSEQ